LNINQLIVFTLEEQEYGIDISYTKEIVRIPQVTKIPNMPAFMEGVINLRGKLIPVIDLKKKFAFTQLEKSIDNRLLILDLEGTNLGIIVDDVSEVVKINEQTIEKLSAEIATVGGNSVNGIAKIDQRLILLLNALALKNEIIKFSDERESAL
jgi:Chemotaxis signal transduction protein